MGCGKVFRERILPEVSGSSTKTCLGPLCLDLLHKGRLKSATPESLLMREDCMLVYDAGEV